jgi:uncharacterized protein
MKKYADLEKRGELEYKINKEFIKKLKRKPPSDLDETVAEIHSDVFNEIDCMSCGNCCRSLGPRITDKDIDRLSKSLRIKPSEFADKYLRIDEDQDYIFKTMPCPFLDDGNFCRVYDHRPKACRDYPHTDRKRFYQLLDITLKNSLVCPGVVEVLGRVRQGMRK